MMEFNDNMWETVDTLPVKVKLLSDTAKLPTYGSEKAACCDLYADIKSMSNYCPDGKIYLGAGQTVKIPTGLAFELPKGWCGLIFARSGAATKKGLRPANCVGVCDEDYRGNYIVAIHNDSDETQVIEHGDRIAQLMICPYIQAKFQQVDELSETNRGEGGFGHTGK